MTPSPETLVIDASEISKMQPWRRSWFHTARGDEPTLFWMILIHVSALVGMILFPLPGWRIVESDVRGRSLHVPSAWRQLVDQPVVVKHHVRLEKIRGAPVSPCVVPDQRRTRRQLDKIHIRQPRDPATRSAEPARFLSDRSDRPTIKVVIAKHKIDGPRDPARQLVEECGEVWSFTNVTANQDRIDGEPADIASQFGNALIRDEVEMNVGQPGGSVGHVSGSDESQRIHVGILEQLSSRADVDNPRRLRGLNPRSKNRPTAGPGRREHCGG